MKKFKTAVIGMFVAAFAASAHASLSSSDLFSSGDGLVTLDSTSNLQWLDLSSTTGLSVDQIQGGAGGWLDQGFRYASFGEFKGFLYSAGLAELSPGSYVAPTNGEMVGSFADGRSFFDLIGGPAGTAGTIGGFLDFSASTYAIRFNLNAAHDPYGITTVDPSSPASTMFASQTFGSYLVRNIAAPVPEPESYALMALGLGMVGWVVRRKKKTAQG